MYQIWNINLYHTSNPFVIITCWDVIMTFKFILCVWGFLLNVSWDDQSVSNLQIFFLLMSPWYVHLNHQLLKCLWRQTAVNCQRVTDWPSGKWPTVQTIRGRKGISQKIEEKQLLLPLILLRVIKLLLNNRESIVLQWPKLFMIRKKKC